MALSTKSPTAQERKRRCQFGSGHATVVAADADEKLLTVDRNGVRTVPFSFGDSEARSGGASLVIVASVVMLAGGDDERRWGSGASAALQLSLV